MTEHLPECPFDAALAKYADRTERQQKIVADLLVKFDVCICPALRACEQRVREDDKNTFLRAAYDTGRADALDAARDAVAALPFSYGALAAIDGLRGPETWQAKTNRESLRDASPAHEAAPIPYGPLICSECGESVMEWGGVWRHNNMAQDDHVPAIDALQGKAND